MYPSSTTSSASSSPISMSENTNLINSFIIKNGLVSRLSGSNETSLAPFNQLMNDKKTTQSIKSIGTSIVQKKPLRKLNNSNCSETQNDTAQLLKQIPQLFDRFIEVIDSKTKISCEMMMCKKCGFLLKKNSEIIQSHLCRQKDIDKFSSISIINNELIFRSKPKNRCTQIWTEFEEVIEPSSNLLLGYARCKRCLTIFSTPDPKSIPAVLRRHVSQCTCGPFPSSLLTTSYKSSSSENKNSKTIQKNSTFSNNSTNSNSSSRAAVNLTSTLPSTNINTSANDNNLSSFISELSSNNLLNAMKNLTNRKNLNLGNLSCLNGINLNNLNNLNNFNNSNSIDLMPLVNNLSNLTNNNSTKNPISHTTINTLSSSSFKLNSLKNEFHDRCIEFCYKELISLEILCSPSFARLSETLLQIGSQSNSHQQLPQLPDTSQLCNHLYSKYSTLRSQLKNDLQLEMLKNIGGAIICDSQDNLSILATYYINSEWKLKEVILNADSYGNEINNLITTTLNDYNLNEEDKLAKFTFLSRGGFFDGVNFLSLKSIAHTIDKIIEETIFFDDTYTDMIENCRLVCTELDIEVKVEPIVENVDWITKYEIMKNVLINVNKYELEHYPLNFELIEFLVNLLTPFRHACELRNCSNHPTLNYVLLWYYKIIKHLDVDHIKLEENENENLEDELDDELDGIAFMNKTKKSVREAVEKHFELNILHKIAVFLWPNFRSLKMLTVDERNLVHDEIRSLIETRIPKEPDNKIDHQFEPNAKKARKDFSDWEELNPLENKDEIQRYISETLPTCDENTILDWWRENQTKFPKLAQLAKWILSIPASVTLIEKFKLHKKAKVDGEILFLHCNLAD